MTIEAKHELREQQSSIVAHSPLPWKLHTFHTMNGETHSLNCVGKSMCGRNWTCYVETAGGDSVLETYGATKEEAIANAQLVLAALAAAQE